jgi:hypothetical protein
MNHIESDENKNTLYFKSTKAEKYKVYLLIEILHLIKVELNQIFYKILNQKIINLKMLT